MSAVSASYKKKGLKRSMHQQWEECKTCVNDVTTPGKPCWWCSHKNLYERDPEKKVELLKAKIANMERQREIDDGQASHTQANLASAQERIVEFEEALEVAHHTLIIVERYYAKVLSGPTGQRVSGALLRLENVLKPGEQKKEMQ